MNETKSNANTSCVRNCCPQYWIFQPNRLNVRPKQEAAKGKNFYGFPTPKTVTSYFSPSTRLEDPICCSTFNQLHWPLILSFLHGKTLFIWRSWRHQTSKISPYLDGNFQLAYSVFWGLGIFLLVWGGCEFFLSYFLFPKCSLTNTKDIGYTNCFVSNESPVNYHRYQLTVFPSTVLVPYQELPGWQICHQKYIDDF